MALIDDVRNALTLRFAPIVHRLRPPAGAERQGTTEPICVTKPRGLEFDLPLRAFGIDSDVTIRFVGAEIAPDRIRWTTRQRLDITVDVPPRVRLESIEGSLVTTIAANDSLRVGDACDAAGDSPNRLFKVSLTTVPEECEVTIATQFGPAILDRITTTVDAGEALTDISFAAGIHADHWESDGCGDYFQRAGTTVTFTALVNRLRAVGTLTESFQWSVSPGAAIVRGATERACSVSLPAAGEAWVSVVITVDTDLQEPAPPQPATLRFLVLTREEIENLQQQCRIQKFLASARPRVLTGLLRGARGGTMIGGRLWVDPLWDPTPDLTRLATMSGRAESLPELRRRRSALEKLAREASALATSIAQSLATREKELPAPSLKQPAVPKGRDVQNRPKKK